MQRRKDPSKWMEMLVTRMAMRKSSRKATETGLGEQSAFYSSAESLVDELMTDIQQSKKKKTRPWLTLEKNKRLARKRNQL